jgi:Carboxypeptidase regulatory-like domain
MCARLLSAVLLLACAASAQIPITGRIVDETGAPVPGARIEFQSPEFTVAASSDRAGNFLLTLPAPGNYAIRADRLGFYRFQAKPTPFDAAREFTIALNHLQEFSERIDVTASSPAIDPAQPSDHKELDNTEIQTVPYPAQQDYRNALPMIDGIVQDNSARPHVNGARTSQTNYTLDGFNLSDPVTGRLDARLNIDSIQAMDVQTARFAAENGRGAAGVVDLRTKMGDDTLRFAGTNFIPGISSDGGWHINKWTPRLELSGPIAKERAWFHNGLDVFYSDDTVNGLPHGQNRTSGLTGSDLTRFQVNLTHSNILTGSFLANISQTDRYGLSFLTPAETTLTHRQALYMSSIRDQAYVFGGALLDVGFADSRGLLRDLPQGSALFEFTPSGNRGNYFSTTDRHFYRQQWVANIFLPTVHLAGAHQLKFGIDFEREAFHQQVRRHDYEVLRDDGSLARYVTFTGSPFQNRKNLEGAEYVQDAWSVRRDLVIETGLRAEWNEIVRDLEIEPRIAAAWSPKALRGIKFSAGWGIYYDAIPLDLISQPNDQSSLSTFYPPTGPPLGPITTVFTANDHALRAPFSRTASASVERRLPRDFYLRSGYSHRTGNHSFVFTPQVPLLPPALPPTVAFQLSNSRQERYDAADISLRHTFAGRYEWSIGYTRSATRSNAAVDYSVENPVFAPQSPGPFVWDTPNRVHMWGWAPLPKLGFVTRNTTISYLAEYRTGFPFSVTTEDGFLMGNPNSWRFPAYFSLNLAFERQFHVLHYLWAWRFGFNNITNNGNPNAVNSVYGTSQFLTYGRGQARAFAVRLRLLGRK